MKISTAFLFDRATDRMVGLQNRLATTQAQLATGKQILAPSDAPDQAAATQRLRGEVERQESHFRALQGAMRRFDAEETALRSASGILVRIKELALQAANDTLSTSDRRALAGEMQALRDQLLSAGNSRDDGGNFLFSGTRVNTPAFREEADGRVVYQGDQTQTRVPAGVERTVQYTRSGTDVFVRVVRQEGTPAAEGVGFFDAIDQLIAGVEQSDPSAMQRGIGEMDTLHDGVTLALARTGADQSVVDSQTQVLEETTLRLKSTLSEIEDLDYTEAITRMNKQMMALEAAMSSFSKISGLNLFDYVRN